jgi:toxin ParE1/3/4
MKVRYTDIALTEIDDIFSYIAIDSRRAAAAVLREIDNTVRLIGNFPDIGTVKHRQTVRMLPVRRYPMYLVFYAVEENEVVILNIRHGARRRPWEKT